ncbi:MYB-related transcription factor [Carex littledalei]|uniref:MYB-related transcription factor n=1 Tax=Carex littledalei TaxID=544730 RepID=A0A833QAG2_9POAL|nr:MYB-related transcription factor [Carex littledalei]
MLVAKCGERNWARVAKAIRSRNSKQCRERWQNILSPDVKRGDWTEEEDENLMNAYSKLGPQWAKISKWLPGRTANAIKNHWNANKRKNLAKRNFKHTKLQEYIASKLDPKKQPSNEAPLQSQPNMQNLNGGAINGYSSNAPLQSQPNMQNLNGGPIHGYPFFLGVGGKYFPVVMLGANFAFPYGHGPIYRAEGSGSSAGGALIHNQDVQSAKESSEVISKKPGCFCDNGKGKEGVVGTSFSI